ncbi:hypothetical protein [Paenibacillus sp. FJAT-26967]|uniref:hypothetical protein n=1 Tax=Paenibacillus sp. FJAT-26967 TaxID=1729690 RepID=UPI0008388E72|nr:hypothetical protein [Paenibacillus sp. FJAT-26967]
MISSPNYIKQKALVELDEHIKILRSKAGPFCNHNFSEREIKALVKEARTCQDALATTLLAKATLLIGMVDETISRRFEMPNSLAGGQRKRVFWAEGSYSRSKETIVFISQY